MEKKDMPAFPQSCCINENGVYLATAANASDKEVVGVTKLEFFACNAPVDIPSWFVHVPPERIICQEPSYDEIENVEDKETCREWRSDQCYDLPDHLKWFQDRTEQASIAYSENIRRDNEAKYFQWRRYYAEQLLLELSKPQP